MLKIAFFPFSTPSIFFLSPCRLQRLDPSSSVSPCPFDGLSFVNPFKMSAAHDDAVSPSSTCCRAHSQSSSHTSFVMPAGRLRAGGCLRGQTRHPASLFIARPPLAPPVVFSLGREWLLLIALARNPNRTISHLITRRNSRVHQQQKRHWVLTNMSPYIAA